MRGNIWTYEENFPPGFFQETKIKVPVGKEKYERPRLRPSISRSLLGFTFVFGLRSLALSM
jgi:hypothetical protein